MQWFMRYVLELLPTSQLLALPTQQPRPIPSDHDLHICMCVSYIHMHVYTYICTYKNAQIFTRKGFPKKYCLVQQLWPISLILLFLGSHVSKG